MKNIKTVIFLLLCACKIVSQTSINSAIDELHNTYGKMVRYNPHNPPSLYSYGDMDDLPINGSRQNNTGSFTVSNFNPFLNNSAIGIDNGKYELNFAHEFKGIPDKNTAGNQTITVSFNVTNNSNLVKKYKYMVYWQNRSYKYNELNHYTLFKSGENFYGRISTDDPTGLIPTSNVAPNSTINITNVFRIIADPRGDSPGYVNNYPLRMGDYEFMIFIFEDGSLEVPEYLFNIKKEYIVCCPGYGDYIEESKSWGMLKVYLSPFILNSVELYGLLSNTVVIKSEKTLKLYAKPSLSTELNDEPYNAFGNDRSSFSESQFNRWEICEDSRVSGIPVITDLDEYSQLDYNWNKHFYSNSDSPDDRVNTEMDRNIGYHNYEIVPGENMIRIFNPKTTCEELYDFETCQVEDCEYIYSCAKRQHAGVQHMLQKYGKFRAKIIYPRMKNKYKVYKGITNTFWFASGGSKTPCNIERQLERTEFDIEFFPSENLDYQDDVVISGNNTNATGIPNKQYDVELWNKNTEQIHTFDIDATFSNHDENCQPGPIFNPPNGLTYPEFDFIEPGEEKTILYDGKTFTLKRKEVNGHVPLTVTTTVQDDVMFGEEGIHYYEVEWKPTEIIFRWGKNEGNLEVVAYYNSEFTIIPSHSMRWIIAQHMIWKGAAHDPHGQSFLPFSAKDIDGIILDATIE